MKKLIIVIALFSSVAAVGMAVTTQARGLGTVTMSTATHTGGDNIWPRTAAQIAALTASTTGQMVFCSDCTAAGAKGTICVSTGSTTSGQFVLSTGTYCR